MKKLFIRTEQPLALEVLGYALCVFTGWLILKILGFQNWEAYVWAAIAVVTLGVFYRLFVAYPDKIVNFVEKFYEKITTYFCRLAGKRGDLIPREKTKYGVIGTSLFIPFIMAFYTVPYLLQTGIGCPVGISYLIAIPMAIIIFIVDRTFVATMGWKKIWHLVLIRIVLATVMGLFLSMPIEMKLFEKETTEELKTQKQEKLAKLEKDREAAMITLKNQENIERAELDRARAEYEREVNESIGGRRAGHGIEAKKKEAYFLEQEALYRNNVEPRIQKRRDEIKTTFDQKKEEYTQTQSYGIGARAQALEAAGKKYPAVKYTAWLIVLMLVMLDLSPLLAKILMPKTQSDRQEQEEEESSEHTSQMSNISRKYALMQAELIAGLGVIEALNLPQPQKDRLVLLERNRVQRRYFGEEALN